MSISGCNSECSYLKRKSMLLICLNENEKRQWCLIYLAGKYSEEVHCSSKCQLTDVIKYAALCRITGLVVPSAGFTLLSLTLEVQTTEDASPKCANLIF